MYLATQVDNFRNDALMQHGSTHQLMTFLESSIPPFFITHIKNELSNPNENEGLLNTVLTQCDANDEAVEFA